jgi:hypothetical protein
MLKVRLLLSSTKDHCSSQNSVTSTYVRNTKQLSWPPLYIHGKNARVEHVMKYGINEFDVSKF